MCINVHKYVCIYLYIYFNKKKGKGFRGGALELSFQHLGQLGEGLVGHHGLRCNSLGISAKYPLQLVDDGLLYFVVFGAEGLVGDGVGDLAVQEDGQDGSDNRGYDDVGGQTDGGANEVHGDGCEEHGCHGGEDEGDGQGGDVDLAESGVGLLVHSGGADGVEFVDVLCEGAGFPILILAKVHDSQEDGRDTESGQDDREEILLRKILDHCVTSDQCQKGDQGPGAPCRDGELDEGLDLILQVKDADPSLMT